MNTKSLKREELLRAYLDGELSAEDAEKVQASLTDSDLDFLNSEKALLERISWELGTEGYGEQCLSKLKVEIQPVAERKAVRLFTLRKFWITTIGVASLVVFGLLTFHSLQNERVPNLRGYLEIAAAQSTSDVLREDDLSTRQNHLIKVLSQHELGGVADRILGLDGKHSNLGHKTRYLNAKNVHLGHEYCSVIYFDCCGELVQILILPSSSKASSSFEEISKSSWGKALNMHSAKRAGFLIAFVGKHASPELLGVFQSLSPIDKASTGKSA